jgi:hypothetical protein
LEGLFWRLLVRPFLPSNPKRREWTAERTPARADAGCRSAQRGCGFDDGRTLCDEGSQALVFGVGPKLILESTGYFGVFSSPSSQPALSDFIGSVQTVSLWTCSHFAHSKVR